MTRDGPAGYHQEEATQHVCQVASIPAAPVGCAIPRQTAHPRSTMQSRERLSPDGEKECHMDAFDNCRVKTSTAAAWPAAML
jgi:hypothetical protein